MKPVATRIRPAEPEDGAALSALYRRSVLALGPRGYGPEAVAAWASLTPTAERLQALMADGRQRLVAVQGENEALDRPVAFADLETDGHIAFFYAAPEVAGLGVASALYDALEEAARTVGIKRLYAEASEVAKGFFARKGFRVLKLRRFAVAGVPIHNHAVEKVLGRA